MSRALPRPGLRRPTTWLAAAVVLALLAGAVAVLLPRDRSPILVSADFHDTTGLYVGNDVEYLGVPIGEITGIDPRGTTMRVRMALDPDSELPRDAGAVILQSSLVTDRHIELGPAYTGGPRLASGAHIDADHTRSPATIDEVTGSIDDLVSALDNTTPGGRDVGDLLHVTAGTLDGNGHRIRDALVAGEKALHTVNGRSGDIRAVTANLAKLVRALAARDRTIRRFSTSVTLSTDVVAHQRRSLSRTLESLAELSHLVTRFVRHNRGVVGDDLAHSLRLARLVRTRQSQLAEAFDTMPTLAQNLAQAYDWKRGRLRVQFSTVAGPFSPVFRAQLCEQLDIPLCGLLFRSDGSGALDPFLALLLEALPGDVP